MSSKLPPESERRDVRARNARDRLAILLKLEPVELKTITADAAEAMAAEITIERVRNGPRP
jgi:hypothetical protein